VTAQLLFCDLGKSLPRGSELYLLNVLVEDGFIGQDTLVLQTFRSSLVQDYFVQTFNLKRCVLIVDESMISQLCGSYNFLDTIEL
jgi:hypothetical protein